MQNKVFKAIYLLPVIVRIKLAPIFALFGVVALYEIHEQIGNVMELQLFNVFKDKR